MPPRSNRTGSARMAELVDALVSNTSEKSCRFDSGSGYQKALQKCKAFFIYFAPIQFFPMNRIERISAILIQLQSKKIVKGQEIADRFQISLRTAYRDIRALEESGVPIISEAGLGYSLVEGYRLPPVMFSKEEAIAFLTAEKLIEKFTDAETFQVYSSGLYKIKAVLKNEDKEHLQNMDNFIEVIKNPFIPDLPETPNFIQYILQSITNRKVLLIKYFANHSQELSDRNVEPIGIFLSGSKWHLIAYCQLRKDYRNFRLDRIQKCLMTDKAFSKKHPPLKTYLKSVTQREHDLKTVVIRIEKKIATYLTEQKYYHGFVSEEEINGKLQLSFLSHSIEGFARWFLMFGDQAEIIQPAILRKRVKEICNQIQEKLS